MKWSVLILCFISLACQKTIHEACLPQNGAFATAAEKKKPTAQPWALGGKGECPINHGVWIEAS